MSNAIIASLMDREYWEDARWAREHLKDLYKYPDQWVAIVDRKPVAADKDFYKAEKEAQQKTGRKNIYMIYMQCTPIIL